MSKRDRWRRVEREDATATVPVAHDHVDSSCFVGLERKSGVGGTRYRAVLLTNGRREESEWMDRRYANAALALFQARWRDYVIGDVKTAV